MNDAAGNAILLKDTPKRLKSQRITALDLARFIAMLMMIQGHSLYAVASAQQLDTSIFPWNLWEFLRGFTAPVFLMVSGAVHVFANKREPDGYIAPARLNKRIKVSLIIMAVGYLMMFPADNIYHLPFIEYKYWLNFFQVNILQLFGISLILLTGIFKLSKSDSSLVYMCALAAVLFTILTPIAHTVNWYDVVPAPFAAYLSFEKGSLFPIFPYSSYLFYGVLLGAILKQTEPERRTNLLIKWGIPFGVLFILAGYAMSWAYYEIGFDIVSSFGKADPGRVLKSVGFVLAGLSFIAMFYKLTKGLARYYSLFGKKALFIYVVHLVIIYGTPGFPSFARIYDKSLELVYAIPLTLCIVIATIAITWFFDYSVRRWPLAREFYKYGITAVLIHMLFI
ncbi:MAG: heparan-alpha-glucosaminide N-acetyltransferase domain-containing protein [Candidatus Kapaibacterium sp.]